MGGVSTIVLRLARPGDELRPKLSQVTRAAPPAGMLLPLQLHALPPFLTMLKVSRRYGRYTAWVQTPTGL